MSTPLEIFTIGHSTQEAEDFLQLLRDHDIEVLVDVRSVPYSRACPQFNKEDLHALLKAHNIYYGYMGEQFGARYSNPSLLRNGQVSFDLVRRTPTFEAGIKRLERGLPSYRIALMCSERDPLTCHRFGLISSALSRRGIAVSHITPEKVISQQDLEKQLLTRYQDLIDTITCDLPPLDQAYHLLNNDIGYRPGV